MSIEEDNTHTHTEDKARTRFAPLRCYTKAGDTKTILCSSKKPTQLHTGSPPTEFLPPTHFVEWEWRTKKCQKIDKNNSKYTIEEIPEFAEGRHISTNSTRDREKRLQEIQEAKSIEEWQIYAMGRLQAQRIATEEKVRQRKEEIAQLQELAAKKRKYKQKSFEIQQIVQKALSNRSTKKIAEIVDYNCVWKILGYRTQKDRNARVVLQGEKIEEPVVVWANRQLEELLEGNGRMAETETDSYNRTLGWFPTGYIEKEGVGIGVYIRIHPPKKFSTKDGREIVWHPIRNTIERDKENIAEIEVPEIPMELPENTMQEIYNVPQAKDTTKVLDMEPGVYICRKFACTTYRKKERILLYLVPAGEDGNPTTDEEIPVYGFFLQKEIERIGGRNVLLQTKAPILCNLRGTKTTPQKNKDRTVSIAV